MTQEKTLHLKLRPNRCR